MKKNNTKYPLFPCITVCTGGYHALNKSVYFAYDIISTADLIITLDQNNITLV